MITINQKPFKLQDFNPTITKRKTTSKYVLDLDIKCSGIYALEVYELRSNNKKRIYNFRFGYDSDFMLIEEKIDNDHYALKIWSGLYNRIIEKEIDVANYVDDWMKIKIDDVIYTYYFPLQLGIYRLKNYLWNPMTEDLWIEDIKQDSVLQVLGEYANGLTVISETGEMLKTVRGRDCGIYSEIPIGFLTTFVKTNKYVKLSFQKDREKINDVYCYNSCFFDKKKTIIKFNPVDRTLMVFPVYYGKGDIALEVTDESGNVIFEMKQILSEVPIEIGNLHSYIDYKVSFYEKSKMQGSEVKKELLNVRKAFYAWRDLVGYYVRLKEVRFDHTTGKLIQRKKHSFKKVYIYFQDRISEDVFSGRILVKRGNAMIILKELDKIKLEICSDIINGEIDLVITRFGNNLLFDTDKQWIIKTSYNRKASEINLYTVEIKGVDRLRND